MSISPRVVEEIKAPASVSMMRMDDVVEVMKQRVLRRDVLINTAKELAAQMADTLEDSEGWHDASRVAPAREALKRRD